MRLRTSLTGEIAMAKRLMALSRNFVHEVADATYEEMKIEAEEARRRTPVDTGALRGTVRAVEPEVRGRTVTCELTAGGPDVSYALKVHEDLEMFHDDGEAKFIEKTLNESSPYLMTRIGRRIDFKKAMQG